MIQRSIPWTRQPPPGTPIDSSSPLTKGLLRLYSFASGGGVDAVQDGPLWTFPAAGVTDTVIPIGAGKKFNATGSNSNRSVSAEISAGVTALFIGQKHAQILTNSDFLFGNFLGGAGAYDWGFYESSSSGDLSFFAHNGTAGVAATEAAGWVLNAPTRVYVGTYGSGDNNVRIYRDGVLRTTTAQTGNIRQTATTVKVGGWQTSTPNFSSPLMGIWNRALSAAEVKSLYDNPWQLFAPLTRRIFVSAAGGGVTAALTGQSATIAQGVVAGAVAAPVTGQSASIALGTPVAAVSYPVTGQSMVVATGSVGVTVSPALSGQAVTVALGDIAVAGGVSVALTGQSMAVAQGTLAAAVAGSVTGQSAAVATGAIAGAIASPLTGQGTAISQGVVAGAVAAPLTGQGVTISLGTVAGGDVVRALTGASLTISQGSVTNAAASIEVIQPTTYPGAKKQRLQQSARAVAKRRKEEAEAAKAAIAEPSIVEELPRINRLKVENSLAAKFGKEIPNENGDIIALDIEQEALNKRSRMFLILARAALLAA